MPRMPKAVFSDWLSVISERISIMSSECHKYCGRNPNGPRDEFDFTHGDMSEPDAEECGERCNHPDEIHYLP